MSPASAGTLKNIASYSPNNPGFVGKEFIEGFKAKYKEDFILIPTHHTIAMFAEGLKRAKSADPVKVAYAMEGLKMKTFSGEVEMRARDHQMEAPLFITSWSKVDGKTVRYDQNNTGYGWKVEQRIEPYVASQPTSCNMTRPPAR